MEAVAEEVAVDAEAVSANTAAEVQVAESTRSDGRKGASRGDDDCRLFCCFCSVFLCIIILYSQFCYIKKVPFIMMYSFSSTQTF